MSLTKSSKHLIKFLRYSSTLIKNRNHNLNVPINSNINFNKYNQLRLLNVHNLRYSTNTNDSELIKDDLSESNVVVSLENCGHILHDHSLEARTKILLEKWNVIQGTPNILTINVYNAYIKVCIENELNVDHKEFLVNMKCKANKETFNLLLESACKKGLIEEAIIILDVMKNEGLSADETVFNALVLGNTINGGLKGADSILRTMKVAHITETINTKWAIIKGLAHNTNKNEFIDAISALPYDENHFLEVLLYLAINNNHTWIDDFINKMVVQIPRQLYKQIENLCINLIYRKKPEAALYYYQSLIEPTIDGGYGKQLLEEMLKCKIPIETIIMLAKKLITSSLNERALYDVTEIALRNNFIKEALILFVSLDVLRPHYFWPILVHMGAKEHEIGALEILKIMTDMGVKPEFDTIEYYLLPYCDMSDVNALVGRIINMSQLHMKDIMSPILSALLKKSRVNDASALCQKYETPILGEKLLRSLSKAWMYTKDTSNASYLLQKICETNITTHDWAGVFLGRCLKMCKSAQDYDAYLKLVKDVGLKKLQISPLSSDNIYQLLPKSLNGTLNTQLEDAVDQLLDVSKKDFIIQHPRDMNVEELECHLLELTNKQMETRGALRKLLQEHCRLGNYKRVQEVRTLLKNNNYDESPGIKSSLLFTYTQSDQLELALAMFEEIKLIKNSKFILDTYKIIDLASLLVVNDRFDEALQILINETKNARKVPNRSIERNCWKLVGSAKTPENTFKLFETLVDGGFCKASNIMMGPLVKIHLKGGDLHKAVQVFVKCALDYKCTPLQLELLCAVVDCQDEELINKVLEATAAVHGAYATKMTFIAALAENGLEKPLHKLLIEMEFINNVELKKRCERWTFENKLLPLKTLASAASRLSNDVIHLADIQICILKVHCASNDCESALQFWKEVEDKGYDISTEFNTELVNLLQRCNYEIPNTLMRTTS